MTIEYRTDNSPTIKRVALWENCNAPSDKKTGCPLGCIYCNQIDLDTDVDGSKIAGTLYPGIDSGVSVNWQLMTGAKTIRRADPQKVIEDLKQYPYMTPETAIILQNYSDPGLNWNESIGVAKKIKDGVNHTGPTIFITKMSVGEKQVQAMRDFKNSGGKPIVIVTYSGLPKEIEPASGHIRTETMRKFHDAEIPVITSMRPMIMSINTSEDKIRATIQSMGNNTDIVTVGGLYVYPDTAQAFAKAGHQLPDIYLNHKYPVVKVLPEEIRESIRRIASEENPNILVHDHTTCAVANIMTARYDTPSYDPLAHWTNPMGVEFDKCASYCPTEQIVNCRRVFANQEIGIQQAKNTLNRIGYPGKDVVISSRQEGLILVENASLPFSELATIMRETGLRVDNLPDLEGINFKVKEAFKNELSNQGDKLVGCVQAGQEWYVVIDGKIDGTENNFLALKWARSYARCRIPETIDINGIRSEEMATNRAKRICQKSGCPEMVDEVTKDLIALYHAHQLKHKKK